MSDIFHSHYDCIQSRSNGIHLGNGILGAEGPFEAPEGRKGLWVFGCCKSTKLRVRAEVANRISNQPNHQLLAFS